MKKSIFYLLLSLFFAFTLHAKDVHLITIDGVVNPVSMEFIIESVEKAGEQDAELLIIQLDTPGGLMSSMHDIVKSIMAAEVPVAVYVSPSGSRAGSAGVFITMAAHIAAMAPGTNIGSAHPVTIAGSQDTSEVMMEKVLNDAVASIRTVAEKRGRNADWAEMAVRESANITESEALEKNVIDFVVPTVDSLLSVIDGLEVEVLDGKKILNTKNSRIETFSMNWRQQMLNMLSDPNILYILFLLGISGLGLELYNPGAILPGVVGGICIILFLFAVQTIPVNIAGVLLIIFAVVLFLLEIKIPSFGLLSIGGVVSLVLGSIMLIDSPLPFMQISWQVIAGATIAISLFFILAVGFVVRTFKRKPTTGREGLVGEEGIAIENFKREGSVEVHGEIWKAITETQIKKGQKIIIESVDEKHLTINVKPLI
jgi:membrane-bound serine protease (ClpP class)